MANAIEDDQSNAPSTSALSGYGRRRLALPECEPNIAPVEKKVRGQKPIVSRALIKSAIDPDYIKTLREEQKKKDASVKDNPHNLKREYQFSCLLMGAQNKSFESLSSVIPHQMVCVHKRFFLGN